MGDNKLTTLYDNIDEEIEKLKKDLITEREYEKLQNIFENNFVNSNSSMAGIANSLARNYMLYGNTNLINTTIDIYKSITRDEIREVANKYLNKENRVLIDYLPKESE